MAKKFRFEKKFIDFGDICGKTYKVEHNQVIFDKKDEIGKQMEAYQKNIDKITDSKKGLEELDAFLKESVDTFLDAGEYDTIFKDREFDIYERMDLATYVLSIVGMADRKRMMKVSEYAAK